MTWLVVEYTPGYMPDSDEPASFDRWSDACEYAQEEAQRAADQLYDDETANIYRDGNVWRVTSDRPHTLDRIVEVCQSDETIRSRARTAILERRHARLSEEMRSISRQMQHDHDDNLLGLRYLSLGEELDEVDEELMLREEGL